MVQEKYVAFARQIVQKIGGKENVQDLADSLVKVMSSSELRQKMSAAIQKKAETFRIENIAAQWKQLFESL